MNKHTKAFRCRIITNTDRIYRLEKKWHIPIGKSKSPKQAIDYILKNYPDNNIIIKSEKSATMIVGKIKVKPPRKNKKKPHVRGGALFENTTKWLYLIKSDTVWTVKTVNNKHYVGEKIQ